MPDKDTSTEICKEYESAVSNITAADLIRQYHERVDYSPMMSDEDFDGLVL